MQEHNPGNDTDFIHIIRWTLEIITELCGVTTDYTVTGNHVRIHIGDDMEFGTPRYISAFVSGILRGIRLKQAAMTAKENGNV
jgi:hypothetical protein